MSAALTLSFPAAGALVVPASEQASYVTGCLIPADGGASL